MADMTKWDLPVCFLVTGLLQAMAEARGAQARGFERTEEFLIIVRCGNLARADPSLRDGEAAACGMCDDRRCDLFNGGGGGIVRSGGPLLIPRSARDHTRE